MCYFDSLKFCYLPEFQARTLQSYAYNYGHKCTMKPEKNPFSHSEKNEYWSVIITIRGDTEDKLTQNIQAFKQLYYFDTTIQHAEVYSKTFRGYRKTKK